VSEHGKDIFNKRLRFIVPVHVSKEKAWKQIKQKIRINKAVATRSIIREWRGFPQAVVAASLVIMFSIIYLFWSQMNVRNYMTGRGEKISLFLPDSSKVILSSESQLQYNLNRWNIKRKVVLIGEAYFDVRKGNPFVVKTNMGKVNVFGTSFYVLSRKNKFEVYCYTGKVQVQSSDKKVSTILSQGLFTRFLLGNKFSVPQIFDFDKSSSLRNGKVYFKNTSFEEVLTAFELNYNVTIKQSNMSDRYYTGYFPCNNMERALNLICVPMNMRYEIVNDTLVEITNK